MELLRENDPAAQAAETFRRIYSGTVLVGAGLIWLLFNFRLIPYRIFACMFSWPMLVTLIGGYLLLLRRRLSGGIFLVIGIVLLAAKWIGVYIPVQRLALPAVLIAAGIAVICSGRTSR